jgi:hypothetical protein
LGGVGVSVKCEEMQGERLIAFNRISELKRNTTVYLENN